MPAEIQSASGWSARTAAATSAQPRRTPRAGSAPERRHGHHAPQVQVRRVAATASASAARLAGARRRAPRPGSSVEADLHQARRSRRPAASAPRSSAADELGPVDRVHDVGVAGHRAGLVASAAAR